MYGGKVSSMAGGLNQQVKINGQRNVWGNVSSFSGRQFEWSHLQAAWKGVGQNNASSMGVWTTQWGSANSLPYTNSTLLRVCKRTVSLTGFESQLISARQTHIPISYSRRDTTIKKQTVSIDSAQHNPLLSLQLFQIDRHVPYSVGNGSLNVELHRYPVQALYNMLCYVILRYPLFMMWCFCVFLVHGSRDVRINSRVDLDYHHRDLLGFGQYTMLTCLESYATCFCLVFSWSELTLPTLKLTCLT